MFEMITSWPNLTFGQLFKWIVTNNYQMTSYMWFGANTYCYQMGPNLLGIYTIDFSNIQTDSNLM